LNNFCVLGSQTSEIIRDAFGSKTSAIKSNDDSAFPTCAHGRRTNPIRKIESRRGEKGQGSISEWDLSVFDLKFRIPSEPKGPSANSSHSVTPESLRAKQNQDEKIVKRYLGENFNSNRNIFYLVLY